MAGGSSVEELDTGGGSLSGVLAQLGVVTGAVFSEGYFVALRPTYATMRRCRGAPVYPISQPMRMVMLAGAPRAHRIGCFGSRTPATPMNQGHPRGSELHKFSSEDSLGWAFGNQR